MKEQLKKIEENIYEIPKSGLMKVPGRIFISEAMLKDVEDSAIQQLINVATLKGIQKNALAMPDIHSGLLLSLDL